MSRADEKQGQWRKFTRFRFRKTKLSQKTISNDYQTRMYS